MSAWLREYWALVAASVLIVAVVLQALWQMYARSPGALLRRGLRELRNRRQERTALARRARRAKRRLQRMQGKTQSVRPVRLAAARDDLSDAESLVKIAHDQVLVAENHVRRIIVEQFPPDKQEKLRARFRVDAAASNKPFTF